MIKTTVCVMNTTVSKIKQLKIHPRQSSEDVILDLIRYYYNHPLSDIMEYSKYNLKTGDIDGH